MLLTGCGQEALSSRLFENNTGAKPLFDVNDVSILWPLPKLRVNLTQLINLDGTGFLSKENFDRIMDIGVIEDDPGYAFWRIKYWYIVAARLDTCAKVLPTGPCETELRLVSQPMMHFSDSALGADNALHLIYHLSADQGKEVAKILYDLKTQDPNMSTNGKPLDIHPIMAAQGLEGAFAQGMRTLVTTYARETNLKEATAMLRLNAKEWRFVRSLPNAAGELEIAALPFVDGPQQTLFGEVRPDRAPGIFNEIRPHGTNADSLNEAADSDEPSVGGFYKLPEQRQNELLQAALRIDNPLVHTPSTIDCVSCHMASRVLARVKGRDYLEVNDGNPDRYIPPMPMTMTNITEDREITLGYTSRGFGYGIMTPRGASVTQRVINDSARIASDLNQNYLPHF